MSDPSFDFIRDQRKQELRAVDIGQRDITAAPDQAADLWRSGESQGLAPALAMRNPEDVRAEAERQKLDRLSTDSPVLADWLAAKPERLAIARDELDGLSFFEKTIANLVPPDAGTRFADTMIRAPASEAGGYFGATVTGLADLYSAGDRMTDRAIRATAGDDVADALQVEVPSWANPVAVARDVGQQSRDAYRGIGVPEDRRNFATDVAGGVGQLGGMTAQSFLAPQTLFASLLGLGASQQADAAREAGQGGTLEADAAVIAGAPVTALTERFALQKLLERVPPKIKSDTLRWLADKGIAFGIEAGQEITENVAQDVIAAGTFDPARDVGAGAAYDGTVAGTSAAVVRTLLGVRSPLRQPIESAADVERVNQIHALASELKTLDRAPGEVEALVRSIVDRNPGKSPTHVYLDADAVRQYFQGEGLDPGFEVGQLTGDGEAYAAALASGGDLVVPIERYVARVVKSAHGEALKNLARLAPDRASNAELQALDVDALFAGIAPDTSEAADRATAKAEDPVQAVAGAVKAQLEAAGVEPSAAGAQADLLAQRYATRAERRGLGETALQVYEAAQLDIRSATSGDDLRRTAPGAVVPAMDSVLDALRANAVPTETQVYGPSLAEFLAAKGGVRDDEMMGEVSRLEESDRAERKGKKRLVNHADGMLLDMAREAAVEAGYLPEGADINDMMDALDRELSVGKPVYSGGNVDTAQLSFMDAANGLEEMLRDAGIDLATMDNAAVRRALGRQYEQPAAGGRATPRGRILFGKNGERVIELLDGADLSTFHHETGHLFLDELAEDAFADGTPQQLRDDLDALLTHWGVTARTADGRDAVMAAIQVDQHEQFARGYEAYLFEGKAPSTTLADLFGRFRSWMIAVYKQLRRLNVTLTPEVRGIYDRLLATDDAIATAQSAQGYSPLDIPADVRGLVTPTQWAAYEALLVDAATEQRQDVEQRLLAAQQREAKAWWKEKRAEIEEVVQAEAYARPDFVALSLLSRGKLPDGSPAPEGMEGMSLSREELVKQYGERFVIDRLGSRRVYRKEGGLHPSTAAAALGFRDSAALVESLVNAPKMADWINGETDARMRELYPDPLLDGSLPQAALAAVHGNKRLQAIETELTLLAGVAKQPALPPRLLGAAARQRIARMKPRNIRPNDYLVAERKAAGLATKAAAAGKFAEALRRKREQALNAHLYRAARDATAEVDKATDYLREFTRKDKRAALGKAGGNYLEQIDALLELVELRKSSGREVSRRQSLAEWVAQRDAAGEMIDVPDSVLALVDLTNLRDMPMEQVRGLVDTVKQIDHLARLKTKLLLGKEQRDRAEVVASMAAGVRAAWASIKDRTGDRTTAERVRDAFNQGLGAYLRPSTLARDLDGFEDGGAVWTHTVGVMQSAVNNDFNPALTAAQEALAAIWQANYTPAELRQMNTATYRPEAKDSWSHGRILALALNWGNEGNRQAILSQTRGKLTPEQIGALLSTLTAKDAAFLNQTWAYVNTFWPQIAETTRRRTGLAPEKVDASPFDIRLADGTPATLTGGYYPLKYEPDGDAKASKDEQTEFWEAMRAGHHAKAQTRNGHTKERTKSGGRRVRLDIGVLGSHVRDVLRDVHLGDAVNYVHTVLQASEFREALVDAGKMEYGKALELWLRDAATGEMSPRTYVERVARKLRTNFTASLLGFNVSTALIQPTGFLQTGAALGWDTLRTGMQRFLTSPWVGPNAVGSAVDAVSPMMRERGNQSVEAVRKVEVALAGKRDGYVMRHAWAMMSRTQRIVDLVTWLGAEAKGLAEFDGDVAKARAYADDAVQRAQASGEWIDKSALERGTFGDGVRQSELLRGTTALMSYMIAKGNVIYERTRQTSFRDPRQVGLLAVNLTSLLVIENLIIAVMRGGLPDDEDEDGIAEDAALWFAKEGVIGLVGTVPIIAQLGTTLRGYDAQGTVERLSKSGKKVIEAAWDWGFEDEPPTASDAKAAVSLVGMATGLPAAQTNRTLQAYLDAEDGEDVAPWQFATGRPKE